MEVTDDKSLPKEDRKRLQVEHAPHLSSEAKQIKLGDKISNIKDVTDNPPSDWDLERRRKYIEWGQAVAEGLRGSNKCLETLFDETVDRARKELAP
jgi:guanosine-3',5'-bis(diphosphate) 3'-pyrophosphohydrolase